ncbi:hypothetical protein [Methanocaldococcus sp.]|uniref:hypothetical protein n=1 Tax=Methanocaldococcus sp. TaxID=2152917 RepID=UPI00261C97E0|nr:hypothetical protein [Methanocaldococcus sp.]MCQ6254752.1 hypothetical protein [Methanocaldococcus sp.]
MVDLIILIYLVGLIYFAYEDYQYMSIPLLPATLYCILLTAFGSLEWIIIGVAISGLLFALRMFEIGDVLVIIPTVVLFGWHGLISSLLGGIILQIYGLITKKRKLPYIPFLLISMVVIWL